MMLLCSTYINLKKLLNLIVLLLVMCAVEMAMLNGMVECKLK